MRQDDGASRKVPTSLILIETSKYMRFVWILKAVHRNKGTAFIFKGKLEG